jgi:hypothetical protein
VADESLAKRLWLETDTIHYRVTAVGEWTLPVNRVKLLGEYTDPNGPYVDDYFFVFVFEPDCDWYEASFYSEGREAFLSQLGLRLGSELRCGLCHSTDDNSRLIWPPQIEGQPLFDFVPIVPKGLWQQVRLKLVPGYHLNFAAAVRDYLKESAALGS